MPRSGTRAGREADPHLVNAAPLGFQHFDLQAVELEGLADGGHAADAGQHVSADGLEPFGLDLDAEPLAHFGDVHLGAEDDRSVPFVDDRLRLDVVLVADLADDFLEEILDRHQPGGAAVLVDDDGDLDLLALELLQHLRHALGLGHERRRPDQPSQILLQPHAPGLVVGEPDQVLHEHDADDVVEVFLVDRDARVLLLAEERAQLVERRVGADRDHVGPRRHHLAHERVAEVDDRLQQPPFVPFDQPLVGGRSRGRERLAAPGLPPAPR